MKGEYKRLCEEKKLQERVRWEKGIEKIRTEEKVWKIVNKGRKKRKEIEEKIKIKEWDEYFRKILGGVERRVGGELSKEKEEDVEEDIHREEFEKVIRKLKKGKAAGSDKIENEIWKWGGRDVKKKLWKMCKKV
ncbi:arginine and glutamate-rich protein 1-like [Cardiocondyla obscurior]|uniref:arginine and glutamate-rich protein 1-like n=1 Tax=Cardiocondyla obscurior TaxID=286306 RepID=UPI0039658AF6